MRELYKAFDDFSRINDSYMDIGDKLALVRKFTVCFPWLLISLFLVISFASFMVPNVHNLSSLTVFLICLEYIEI